MFLARGQDPIITSIEQRIAKWALMPVGEWLLSPVQCSASPLQCPASAACPMCLPACPAPAAGNGEGLQVLRYEKGQEYEGHYVSFSSGVEVFCKHVFGVLISS